MAELKTKKTDASVEDFLNGVPNERRRQDGLALLKLMTSVTRQKPKMWGPTIVGFGQYHYKYASGHEGDICMAGFSPRGSALVVYLMPFEGQVALLKKLGKHKMGKGCLYINKLEDVDTTVLRKLVAASYQHVKDTYT
jgi:hypothetical protein